MREYVRQRADAKVAWAADARFRRPMLQRFEFVEQCDERREKTRPGVRQLDALMRPSEQQDAEKRLDGGQHFRRRWLGNVKHPGCAPQRAVLDEKVEQPKMPQLEMAERGGHRRHGRGDNHCLSLDRQKRMYTYRGGAYTRTCFVGRT